MFNPTAISTPFDITYRNTRTTKTPSPLAGKGWSLPRT